MVAMASVAVGKKLEEIVRRLVAAYRPERVFLFGSRARGEAGPDSDYGLLFGRPDNSSGDRAGSRLHTGRFEGPASRLTLSSGGAQGWIRAPGFVARSRIKRCTKGYHCMVIDSGREEEVGAWLDLAR